MNLKVLGADRESFHGGCGKWKKGRWRTVRGPIEPCLNGLHYCRDRQILVWLGPALWVFEDGSPGETIDTGDKMVTRRGRIVAKIEKWNDRTARLFAADCAEHVLHLYENKHPGDDRPRKAIEAAREFANGEIDAAAWDAAGDAAGDAERAWQYAKFLEYIQ